MDDLSWTADGTLFSARYDDIYFNDGHGLEETEYVFLQGNNIRQRLASQNTVIGELGFGTGLNFLVTWQKWQQIGAPNKKRLTFISCEKHPLDVQTLARSHEAFPALEPLSAQLRAQWPATVTGFHFLEFEQGQVALLLMFGDVFEVLKQLDAKVDAWYLDGFSPSNNPQMWSDNVFKQLAWHSHQQTTLATFTAAGAVRRGLQEVGFTVERIKGFGRKKHMTVGHYTGHVKNRLSVDPWYHLSQEKKPQKAAVIGAGMAGLNTAWSLARLGVEVTVFDKHKSIASEASGNRWGMMFPLISKKPDRLGALTESGASYSLNQFKELEVPVEEGLFEFATDESRKARFSEAVQRYSEDFLEYLQPEELKELAVDSKHPGLYHKKAVSLSPIAYAESLVERGDFNLSLQKEIEYIEPQNGSWRLTDKEGCLHKFDTVIVCSAYESQTLEQTSYLPLRKTRGQVVYLPKDKLKKLPSHGMNFVNYLVSVDKDNFVLGATFQPDDFDEEMREEDSQSLIDSLESFFPGLLKDTGAVDLEGRVCFRAMLKDHFPVIGPIPDQDRYNELYAELKHGRPVSSYPEAEYREGLYASCGHGSRGLTLAPLAGAYLARLLVDGISILPVNHIQAVHPARFLIKKLKQSHQKKKPGEPGLRI